MKIRQRSLWYYYGLRYLISQRINIKFSQHKFMDAMEANAYIKELVERKEPFAVCRLGATESFALRTMEFCNYKKYDKASKQLCLWSGFFPCEYEAINKFSGLYKACMKQVDVFGTLKYPLDDFFVRKYLPDSSRTTILDHIDSVGKPNPWTSCLEGKKVLIVHPFAETIEMQYKKRELIFPGKNILPKFHLITYKAIQTSAGERDERFSTWFDALDYMTGEIAQIDFDIAILGCGAYGLPLAVRIKEQGRQAVQIGGSLQILFGIKGSRWDNEPEVSKLYNDAWVYPKKSETPQTASSVENGCYWGK